VRESQIEIVPIGLYRTMLPSLCQCAKALDFNAVVIGASLRSAFYHMPLGHVVKGLMKKLPHDCHLMIIN
jgi:menaquinone-dependent protoporphyrinogen IX oxidase